MQLYIKQKVFSWGDKFTVKDAAGQDRYTVEGEIFSWGKKLHVYDMTGREAAFIKQELWRFLPTYSVFQAGRQIGEIKQEISLFRPRFSIDGLGWEIQGSFWEHEYTITQGDRPIVSISKEWMTWGDSYVLNIANPADEIVALAVVLAIDCAAASKN